MKWFAVFPQDAKMAQAMTDAGVEAYARKGEDGMVHLFTWDREKVNVDNVETVIRTAESMRTSFRVGRDAYGQTFPVSTKTAERIDRLWNLREKRGQVRPAA